MSRLLNLIDMSSDLYDHDVSAALLLMTGSAWRA